MKHFYAIVFFFAMAFSAGVQAQSVPDTVGSANNYFCDFEDTAECSAWTFVNGTMTNQWYIGTAANNTEGGSKALYISNDGGASRTYDIYAGSTVYAYREFYFEAGSYLVDYNWTGQGEYNNGYMIAAAVPQQVQLTAGYENIAGVGIDTLPEGWINLGYEQNDPYSDMRIEMYGCDGWWSNMSSKLWIREPGVYRVVFVWHNEGSWGGNPPAAVDDITVTWQNCPWVKNLRATDVTDSTLTLAWTPGGDETCWNVSSYIGMTVDDTTCTLHNLQRGHNYWVGVSPCCGGSYSSYMFRTECGEFEVPYTDNFMDWNRNTDYCDHCWTKGGTHWNSLYWNTPNGYYYSMPTLEGYNWNNDNNSLNYTYVALPKFQESIDSLTFHGIFVCQENNMTNTSYIAVGIMSDPNDFSTFVGIDTIDLHDEEAFSEYRYKHNLKGYGGLGDYIAIAAIAPQLYGENYSYNRFYIESISVTKEQSCSFISDVKLGVEDTTVTVDWRDDGEATNWLVKVYNDWFEKSVTVQNTHAVVSGLPPAIGYYLSIAALCGDSDTGTATTKYFTTLCAPIAHSELPYSTSFEDLGRDEHGNINNCWRGRNNENSYYPRPEWGNAHNGVISLVFQVNPGKYAYAVLPRFEDSLSELMLNFYCRREWSDTSARLYVGVMSDPNDVTTFDTVATIAPTINHASYFTRFENYAVNDRYIALMEGSENGGIIYVDDVIVRENDPCSGIMEIAATDVGDDSVMVNWTFDGQATQFEIVWGNGSIDPDFALNRDTVSGNSLLLTDAGGNHVSVYGRPLCDGNTLWHGPADVFRGVTTMQNNSTVTITGCQIMITDNGGSSGDYSDNFQGQMVLIPNDSTKSFRITGHYNTESCCDHIYIYDGTSTNTPLLAQLQGEGDADNLQSHGPVTVVFRTDGSVTREGFELTFTCIDDSSSICTPVAAVNVDNRSATSAEVSWTMQFPNLPMPENFLVRWADSTGTADSLYTTSTHCTIQNLQSETRYSVAVKPMCDETNLDFVTTSFITDYYRCAERDTTAVHNDTLRSGITPWLYSLSALPGSPWYNYSFSQQLFYNTEVDTGMITTISFYVYDYFYERQYEIYLAQTDDTLLTQILYPANSTKVYGNRIPEMNSNQWMDFELTTPYHYDGQGNLLVTFIDVTGTGDAGNNWWEGYDIDGNSLYFTSNSPIAANSSDITYFNTSNHRNSIIFKYEQCLEEGTCVAPNVRATEIDKNSIAVRWMADSCAHFWNVEHRIAYGWEWITDATGITETSFTFDSLESNTLYELRVTANGDSKYSRVITARTRCDAYAIPYIEYFENIEYGENGMPVCWNKGSRGQETWITCCNGSVGGYHLYMYPHKDNEYFTLPKLDTTTDSLTLYFSVNTWGRRTIEVGVMTNPLDFNTYQRTGEIIVEGNDRWEACEISLAGMDDGYITVVPRSSYTSFYFDAFEVLPNRTCERPKDIHTTRITARTAVVEWTSTGASEYLVVCTDKEYPNDTIARLVTQNPKAVITGMEGSHNYMVQVAGICAAGDTSYPSQPFVFATTCSIQEVPYTEHFDDYGTGTNYHTPYCWSYGSFHNYYPFLSHSFNHTQDGYAAMYMYCEDKNGEGNITYLMMPELELDTLQINQLQIAFYAYAQNNTSEHRLIVGVCDTIGMMSTFTPVDTVVIDPYRWDIYEVTFDSYSGTGQYITFVSSVAPGSRFSYPYIDDLTLEPIPPCQRPNNLYANEESATANTIEIGWNDRSGATQWIVEYGDKGFTPGTGTQVVANSNPFTLTGIHRGYEGEFYVKAVCSSESSSDWSRRPCRFKTVCDTMSDVIVACDSYTWHGTTYNSSITGPLYDAPDIPSCDSLVVLHLTVKHSTEGTETLSACDSYTWYGNTYTASTTAPTHHMTNAVGCDSTAHLSLTIRYSTESTESQTACDSYTWYGNTYNTSTTTPTHMLTNAVGCDSTAHLHLTMKYSTAATEQIVTCDQSSYTWHGQTFTESTNSATYTLPNTVGCDSVITLHLNMSHSDTGIETIDVCDSYTWHGNTYTASTNTATYETNTVAGCDSTVTLHLTIRYSNAANFSDIACDSYSWHGNTYTASTTTPTYTSTNIAGCDSTTTLLLTILNSTSSNEIVSACDSYQWHGTTYTASTSSPTFITTNAVGCDSVIHLNLTVRYSSESTLPLTACDSYTWHGTTYTASTNTPTWLTLNNAGCDSLVTLNLTVNYSNTGIDNQTACDSYTWHGTTYTASTNTPTYLSTNNMGCDSTTTLHLTVNYSNSGIETVSECDSYLWHGTVYTASTNTPTFMSTNAAGCDSTTTLHLTMNYSSSSIDNVTACDSYRWHGVDYTTSTNTPTFATSNAVGCDSTVVLHLTVNYSNTGIDNQTACDSYTWHGIAYTTSVDTATFVETNAAGCDSTVTLHLTVNYSTTGSESATACDSYTWYGNTYTTSGTPTYQETNAAGCDSTVTLHLTVNYSTTGSESTTACDSYTWHGSTYTTSGTPTHQETNAAGCDSTITLTLTINYSNTGSESATACDSLLWHGNIYTTSGNPTYPTTNAAGCDSTVTLNLTINYSSTGSESATACDSFTWNNVTYAESGEYSYQTTNAAGCDSTVTLTLTINTSSQTEIADTATGSYQWNGESYTESGTYTWTGTNAAGCDSTVTLHLFIQEVGINTVDGTNAINVYPNPTSGLLNIDAEGLTAIEVYDINGRVVATYGAENKINIASLPAGAYTLRIQTQQGNHIRRIILK
ncbi:MAG: T9SS type A sorting domain-containing protein [Bacteroidales bacterium]|nr:T9SS type A sorting domain-containing protein [Bacteroidales bacterium]